MNLLPRVNLFSDWFNDGGGLSPSTGVSVIGDVLCNATKLQSATYNPANNAMYNLPIAVRLCNTSKTRGRPH